MNLTDTTHSLELVLGSSLATTWTADWTSIDKSGATATDVGSAAGSSSTAGDITIVAAPGANVRLVVTSVTVTNTSGSTQTVTIQKDVSGTEYPIKTATLLTGESLIYTHQAGWDVYNANGRRQGEGADGADGATGAAGTGTTGSAVLDFGIFPGASDASVAVTGQAGILSGSTVECWLKLAASADHSADEHWVETLEVYAGNIAAGTGFTIYGRNTSDLFEPDRAVVPNQRAAGGAFTKDRPRIVPKGTRIYGQWNVFWRWS